jgi:glycosyl transferase family 25
VLLIITICYPVGYYVLEENKAHPLLAEVNFLETNPSLNKNIVSYIINLDGSKKRYNYVKNEVDKIGFAAHRISAINGRTMSDKEIDELVDLNHFKMQYRPIYKGVIGCSLSHIKAWKTFLASDYELALIFEDDVSFNPRYLRQIIDELLKYRTAWDFVNFETYFHGNPIKVKELKNGQNLSVFLSNATDSGTYLLNRKAARELLAKALPLKMPIDNYCMRSWEFDFILTGLENPRIVVQDFGSSDITQTEAKYREKLSFAQRIKRKIYHFQTSLIRHIYNFSYAMKIAYLGEEK